MSQEIRTTDDALRELGARGLDTYSSIDGGPSASQYLSTRPDPNHREKVPTPEPSGIEELINTGIDAINAAFERWGRFRERVADVLGLNRSDTDIAADIARERADAAAARAAKRLPETLEHHAQIRDVGQTDYED